MVLYLAGFASASEFQLNATETVSAAELSAWLAELEKNLPPAGKVTVVIEAPDAGSFMAGLANPTRPRIVITSTQSNQPALMADHRVNSFSYTFWSQVMDGAPLKTAFSLAQQAIVPFSANGQALHAQGDVNGDGRSDVQDAAAVGDYCLGMCSQTASNPPVISPPRASVTLGGTTSLGFTINIQHNANLLEVWALIQRPWQPGSGQTNPLDLEKIPLACDARQEQCTGRYYRFDAQGQYRISFYALDTQYKLSAPVAVDIIQPQTQAVVPAEYDDQQGLLYLYDVDVSGKHYQATLQQQSGQFNVLSLGLTPYLFNPAAHFDTVTNLLDIPLANAYGQTYQASFRLVDDYLFQLVTATPK